MVTVLSEVSREYLDFQNTTIHWSDHTSGLSSPGLDDVQITVNGYSIDPEQFAYEQMGEQTGENHITLAQLASRFKQDGNEVDKDTVISLSGWDNNQHERITVEAPMSRMVRDGAEIDLAYVARWEWAVTVGDVTDPEQATKAVNYEIKRYTRMETTNDDYADDIDIANAFADDEHSLTTPQLVSRLANEELVELGDTLTLYGGNSNERIDLIVPITEEVIALGRELDEQQYRKWLTTVTLGDINDPEQAAKITGRASIGQESPEIRIVTESETAFVPPSAFVSNDELTITPAQLIGRLVDGRLAEVGNQVQLYDEDGRIELIIPITEDTLRISKEHDMQKYQEWRSSVAIENVSDPEQAKNVTKMMIGRDDDITVERGGHQQSLHFNTYTHEYMGEEMISAAQLVARAVEAKSQLFSVRVGDDIYLSDPYTDQTRAILPVTEELVAVGRQQDEQQYQAWLTNVTVNPDDEQAYRDAATIKLDGHVEWIVGRTAAFSDEGIVLNDEKLTLAQSVVQYMDQHPEEKLAEVEVFTTLQDSQGYDRNVITHIVPVTDKLIEYGREQNREVEAVKEVYYERER